MLQMKKETATMGIQETGFSQMPNENAKIGIFVFIVWKQKNPVTKCYPPPSPASGDSHALFILRASY